MTGIYGKGKHWYQDGYGLKDWVAFAIFAGVCLLVIGVMLGIFAWVDATGCEQRAVSRPEIPVEWHWNTGCILTQPDSTVVFSS